MSAATDVAFTDVTAPASHSTHSRIASPAAAAPDIFICRSATLNKQLAAGSSDKMPRIYIESRRNPHRKSVRVSPMHGEATQWSETNNIQYIHQACSFGLMTVRDCVTQSRIWETKCRCFVVHCSHNHCYVFSWREHDQYKWIRPSRPYLLTAVDSLNPELCRILWTHICSLWCLTLKMYSTLNSSLLVATVETLIIFWFSFQFPEL